MKQKINIVSDKVIILCLEKIATHYILFKLNNIIDIKINIDINAYCLLN